MRIAEFECKIVKEHVIASKAKQSPVEYSKDNFFAPQSTICNLKSEIGRRTRERWLEG